MRNGPATTNNYLSNGQNNYNSYNGVMKIDHRFNDKNSMFVRYFVGTGTQTADIGSHIPGFFQIAPSHMHNISVADTAILSPRMVNVLTLGVNYFYQSFNDANTGVNPLALGLNTGATQAGADRVAENHDHRFRLCGRNQPGSPHRHHGPPDGHPFL